MNIFKKAKSIGELTQMLKEAQRNGYYEMEKIENDYQERLAQLSEGMELTKEIGTKTEKRKKNYAKMLIQAGNRDLPKVKLHLKGEYKSVNPKDVISYYTFNGVNFDDYMPFIRDNKLHVIEVKKNSQLWKIAEDIELSKEEGKKIDIYNPHTTKNLVNPIHVEGHGWVSSIQTLFFYTDTPMIWRKMETFFGYQDGILKQIYFS